MKYIATITSLIIALFFMSCNQKQPQKKSNESPILGSKIEVLDFHSTHRCKTCNAIEANTKYTLSTFFDKEMKAGKLTFQLVNIDLDENEAMAEKFQASGTALFLNVVSKGKENQIELTELAFMKGNDKSAFSEALKAEINTALKSL